ncbi:MAG: DUF4394 domain-containing protein, partial [Acidobacteria bacterium]|nr:DUF4394 domain-containing protein [Acidobacteriota bacterium]
MKNYIVASTLIVLVLVVGVLSDFGGRSSAKSKINPTHRSVSGAATFITQSTGGSLQNASVYALTSDNNIYIFTPGSSRFVQLTRVTQIDGNLIGIDYRPADGNAAVVYGLTDTGKIYLINLASTQLGAANLVNTLTTRFDGGFQSLMDFNPVANALRVIGSNDQNIAVLNGSGNLAQTMAQTALAYAMGDVNAGTDPNIAAGAYTNNFAGAPNTLFYTIDYALDTFVTISTRNSTGSSNTGGGQLQTIGSLVDSGGNPINFASTADFDIFTDSSGVNTIVAISGQTLYTINLSQVNQSLALGTTQNITARVVGTQPTTSGDSTPTGSFIDVAVSPFQAAPAPTPTPTPAIQAVTPILECVTPNNKGNFLALFGYSNPNP